MRLKSKRDLALLYTPGVAEPCRKIAARPDDVFKYTIKSNCVAVVSDGSAVLGLGNIGAAASIPVMEGKALLFKEFAGIDAFPICVDCHEPEEIIRVVRAIAPVFGGINLEDISAPKCFAVEEQLQDLGIPVMHDDQHGTAIVVAAGVLNALKVVGKNLGDATVAISGAGAAGTAVAKMFLTKKFRVKDVLVTDSKGIVSRGRSDLNDCKKQLAAVTNKTNRSGGLQDAMRGADVFIGVSAPGIVTREMVGGMARDAVVFAMANPVPEIMPDEAAAAGARVVGTGRSDFPNQVNNVLAFPGVFRGALDARAPRISEGMKQAAAIALAGMVKQPSEERVLPDALDKRAARKVASAVRRAALKEFGAKA